MNSPRVETRRLVLFTLAHTRTDLRTYWLLDTTKLLLSHSQTLHANTRTVFIVQLLKDQYVGYSVHIRYWIQFRQCIIIWNYQLLCFCYLTMRLLYLKSETNQHRPYRLTFRSICNRARFNILNPTHWTFKRTTSAKDSSPSHVWWPVPVTPVKKPITDPCVRINGQDFPQEAFL